MTSAKGSFWQEAIVLFKEAGSAWSEDKVPRLSAALAYYTFFSLAPLLVIVIAIAGTLFGADAVRGKLDNQIAGLVGQQSAIAIQELVRNAYQPSSSWIATSLATAAILLGVSGLFGELQGSLNTIWGVKPKPNRSWLDILKERFVSFSMVFGIVFLLLVSLVISAAIAAVIGVLGSALPLPEFVPQVIDTLVSIGVITLLFAMIFKVLPDVQLTWKNVWVGSGLTAVLFVAGKSLISFYLGHSSATSAYGAAGSLVVVLLWVYYTAQILFFGAEFTKVFTRRYSEHPLPTENAMLAEESLSKL
ncbi:MAG: YihY/virulence factor BrkB family protein [Anaerolineae bacterium]|nr:YihY/virulence factor BrkB family protein [Gloeobacterales cyanobacterium ES-bin-313]